MIDKVNSFFLIRERIVAKTIILVFYILRKKTSDNIVKSKHFIFIIKLNMAYIFIFIKKIADNSQKICTSATIFKKSYYIFSNTKKNDFSI
jgi:hypothetical protein